MSFVERVSAAGQSFVKFFRESRGELRKVLWPSRKETGVYTMVVVVTVFLFGLGIWVIDSVFSNLLKWIL